MHQKALNLLFNTRLIMRQKIYLLILLLLTCVFVEAKSNTNLQLLLVDLDKAIANINKNKQYKDSKISSLKHSLDKAQLSLEEQYDIQNQLYTEYEFYKCDSARYYALNKLSIAEKVGNEKWIIDSKINLASVLFKIAMFNNAIDILDSIEGTILSETQKIEYFRAYYETYVAWVDFAEDGYGDAWLYEKRDFYYNAFLNVLPIDSYEYACYYGIKYINENKLDEAEKILLGYQNRLKSGTRPYSILNSVLCYLYQHKGCIEKEKEYLALSALSDIEGNIMDNASLRSLAGILYEEGDIDRANYYIKRSMEDANFYNARIRNIQVSKVLPIINQAYQTDKTKQHQELKQLFTVISILSVILLIAIFFIVRQMRRISKTKRQISLINKQLEKNNIALADSNRIKEEYIGHFMELCSVYIEKMEKYQKKLYNKAKTSTAEDLFKTIKSTQFVEDARTEFYGNFDASFLNLYPGFVDEFNKLLPEKDTILLKPNERLTTELRIFALIRLGIDDSAKIAEFLNYSITTIYNYRSRFRNKSLVPSDQFEEKIKEIGASKT